MSRFGDITIDSLPPHAQAKARSILARQNYVHVIEPGYVEPETTLTVASTDGVKRGRPKGIPMSPEQRALRSRLNEGSGNPNWGGGSVAKECERCGASFVVIPSRGESARFCSLPCFNKWQKETHPRQCPPEKQRSTRGIRKKPPAILTCVVCGVQKEVRPHVLTARRTCSPQCAVRLRLQSTTSHWRNRAIGKRADLNNTFFRSSWEANYARYLNLLMAKGQVAKWEFEPETFWFEGIKRGCRSYTPDFRVTSPGGDVHYVEVKGYMSQKGRTKLARMGRYHPAIKIELVGKAEYYRLATMFARACPGWEYTKTGRVA